MPLGDRGLCKSFLLRWQMMKVIGIDVPAHRVDIARA